MGPYINTECSAKIITVFGYFNETSHNISFSFCLFFLHDRSLKKARSCTSDHQSGFSNIENNLIGSWQLAGWWVAYVFRTTVFLLCLRSNGPGPPQSSTLALSHDIAEVSTVTLSHCALHLSAGATTTDGWSLLTFGLHYSPSIFDKLQFTCVHKCHQMSRKCQGLGHEDGHGYLEFVRVRGNPCMSVKLQHWLQVTSAGCINKRTILTVFQLFIFLRFRKHEL